MIFTGSNELSLQSNTDATRRVLKKYIYPLNFLEYLYLKYFHDFPDDLEEAFPDLMFKVK